MNKHETKLIFGGLREEIKDIASLNESDEGKDIERKEEALRRRDFKTAMEYQKAINRHRRTQDLKNQEIIARTHVAKDNAISTLEKYGNL